MEWSLRNLSKDGGFVTGEEAEEIESQDTAIVGAGFVTVTVTVETDDVTETVSYNYEITEKMCNSVKVPEGI